MTFYRRVVLGSLVGMFSVFFPRPVGAQAGSDSVLLVVPEAKGHRLVLVDPRLKTVVGSIPVPGWPHEVAFSKDGGTAYVPSYSDAIVGATGVDGQTIDVVDMKTRAVIESWDLGKPLRPHKAMPTNDGQLLVTTELANSIAIVDAKTGKTTGEIPTGAAESHVFVMTANGEKIYTANVHAGSVSVIDVASRKVLKVIHVSGLVQRVALSKDERWLFVSDGKSHNVVLIDTNTDTVARTIAMAGSPFSLKISPDGRWLLVGEDSDSKGRLEAVDLKNLTIAHSFGVDRLPYGIQVVGDEASVACYLSGNVDVLNLSTWTLEAPIPGVAHGDGIAVWRGLE